MDHGGDGDGGLTATGLICAACGMELPPDSRFCNKCGAPITPAATSAEYKQVTVVFADVVANDDRLAQRFAAKHGWRLVSMPMAMRGSDDEFAAAQTTPYLAQSGGSAKPLS